MADMNQHDAEEAVAQRAINDCMQLLIDMMLLKNGYFNAGKSLGMLPIRQGHPPYQEMTRRVENLIENLSMQFRTDRGK